ncbi:hypothetical protein V502_06356 [Pseudogymnoascus sp. VKM F-4520 (FW-2644)]|nr:hypothetical protein V502_06356 [Pseudogymnoascus sp. VKM F-4520 (FW-2644)]
MYAAQNSLRQGQVKFSGSSAAAITAVVAGCYALYSYSTRAPERSPKTFGRGPGFTSLQVHSVEQLSPDTKRLRFALPRQNAISGLTTTSALLTLCRPESHLFPVIRPYTPSDLDEPGFVDLVVKKYPHGKASSHIHSLKPGQSLSFIGSITGYSWKQNEFPHITLIAGGAGITPMYQLIRGIFKNPEEKTKVTLLWGINSDADALFREDFAQYEKQFPDRFKVVYTASHPVEGSPLPKGYISKELIANAMDEMNEKSGKVFLCEPPAMEKALLGIPGRFGKISGGILSELGYSKDQIFKF